jgi:Mg2+ and Co2+ transporter CorA
MAKKGDSGGICNREQEVERDRELWTRLDELEREEEEYLAKERERELAAATNELSDEKGKHVAENEDKPTIRTRFSDDSEEEKYFTVNVKGRSQKSKQLAATSGPLRITVKHTPSQDAAAPKMVCMIHSYMYIDTCRSI